MRHPDMPIYADILAERWKREAEEEGDREFAVEGTRIRHSWAGKCSRAIYYHLEGREETNPPDLPNYHTFGIGQLLHEAFQAELKERYGEHCEIEVKVHNPDAESSGHIDAVVKVPPGGLEMFSEDAWTDAIELKTINGYGFKEAVGAGRGGTPKGPRYTAVIQGALNGYVLGADRVVIAYLSLEAISKQAASRSGTDLLTRFCAEWHYYPEEFNAIAEGEINRWKWLYELQEQNSPPPRWIPDPGLPDKSIITDPARGAYQSVDGSRGTYWACEYCEYRDLCITDPRG